MTNFGIFTQPIPMFFFWSSKLRQPRQCRDSCTYYIIFQNFFISSHLFYRHANHIRDKVSKLVSKYKSIFISNHEQCALPHTKVVRRTLDCRAGGVIRGKILLGMKNGQKRPKNGSSAYSRFRNRKFVFLKTLFHR